MSRQRKVHLPRITVSELDSVMWPLGDACRGTVTSEGQPQGEEQGAERESNVILVWEETLSREG